MAEVLGEGTIVLPVCEAYRAVTEKYPTLVDPYLEPGVECGDNGQQKNFSAEKWIKVRYMNVSCVSIIVPAGKSKNKAYTEKTYEVSTPMRCIAPMDVVLCQI